MEKQPILSNAKIGLVLAGLVLALLSACGDRTSPNSAVPGGQVPPNTVAPQPTNTPAPQVTIDTRPAVTPFDPDSPVPTPKPYPTGQPVAGVSNFGTTVNVHGKVTNIEAEQKFLEAYKQGQPGQWEYVLYTIEGAPIPNRFVYKGTGRKLTLISDGTRDGFAAPEDRKIVTYTCQELIEAGKYLGVSGCLDSQGHKTEDYDFPLN